MAVRTNQEVLELIKTKFADDTSDETLTLIEDVSDTLNDLESKSSGQEDWKKKYEDNDKEWREKYKARFFDATNDPASDPGANGGSEDGENDTPPKPLTFDELFKESEGK